MTFGRETARGAAANAVYDIAKCAAVYVWLQWAQPKMNVLVSDWAGMNARAAGAWALLASVVVAFLALFALDWWNALRARSWRWGRSSGQSSSSVPNTTLADSRDDTASISEQAVIQQAEQLRRHEKQVLALAAQVESRTIDLRQARDEIKKIKNDYALERLTEWSGAQINQEPLRVTIRFAAYGDDYRLVKEIERIFKECGWPSVELDGKNDPVLPQAERFKVIFVFGIGMFFGKVAHAFDDGDLLGVTIGQRMTDIDTKAHLIVEVLPSGA